MCGIAGFNWCDSDLIKRITSTIKSRGPDQEGFHIDREVSLGHRRLSIIDLSEKGRQPIYNENRKIAIVFNGEIFNYQEIKVDLVQKGHNFVSSTDTEVIIHAYEEYGVKCLEKFNGQFAFCIYDMLRKKLFLARDRIGINPLFYYYNGEKFIFGSELKTIISTGIEKEINQKAVDHYIYFRWPLHHECIIKNAYKIEPGHYLEYDLDQRKITEYKSFWKPDFSFKEMDEKKAIKELLIKLEKAVQLRMIADVPVGAFLSGGLDSSAIVAMMSKYTKNLNTFSIKFNYQDFDESKYAKIISNKFKTIHHEIEFTANDVLKLIPQLIYHYDEPFGDSSMIPTFLVSMVARKYVKVSLSGDGGDELFGGYKVYLDLIKTTKILENHKFIIKISSILIKILKTIAKPLFKNKKLRKIDSLLNWYSKIPTYEKYAHLLSVNQLGNFSTLNGEIINSFQPFFNQSNILNNTINTDYHNYLPDDILTKVDRASLANSLESRPPFLDHNLIEFANKLPPELKIKGKETKYILKKALEGILPKEIIYRKKKGFGVPIKHYFKNELKDFLKEKVVDFDKHQYFSGLNISKLYYDHVSCKEDNSAVLWSILMFNLWYERWFFNST